MKEALVVHPRFSIFGGGELLSLSTIKALQDADYHVSLLSDTFDTNQAETVYGLGKTMAACDHIQIPQFKELAPRFLALQRIWYVRKFRDLTRNHPAKIVFNTQSSLFPSPRRLCYHFIYDIVDLFAYPRIFGRNSAGYKQYYSMLRPLRKALLGGEATSASWFFALAQNILAELNMKGYHNSSLMYPPCRMDFHPQEKNPFRIIQVTRIVPQKRLERFFEIARLVPECHFVIVGRDSPILRSFNPQYAEQLMAKKPDNVTYIESPIKQVPDLLEKAKIYLYTGEEPGIGIALVEAVGAGCIPLSPVSGGGAEVVKATTGFLYRSPREAAEIIRDLMEHDYYLSPDQIREKAKAFSPEVFESRIRELLGH